MSDQRWPFNLLNKHPIVYCRSTIVLSSMSETCCMRPKGHGGPCSIYMDTPAIVVAAPQVTSTPHSPFVTKART